MEVPTPHASLMHPHCLRLPHRITFYAVLLLLGIAGWTVLLGELVMLRLYPSEALLAMVVALTAIGLGGLLRWIASAPQDPLDPSLT